MVGTMMWVHDVDEDAYQGREPHPDTDMIGHPGIVVAEVDIEDESGMAFVKVCLSDGRVADFALGAEVWPLAETMFEDED